MTFRDAVSLALRNLRQSKLRTFLTVLGVAIGIASLSGMVSLGVGLQDQFVDRFTRSGMFDSINVMPRMGEFGGSPGGRLGRLEGPRKPLDDSTIAQLSALAHVREVYPNLRVPLEAKHGTQTQFVTAAGVPMSTRDRGPFQTITHGRFFANETDAACMLSLDMARRFDAADPAKMLGRELTFGYAALDAQMQVKRVEFKAQVVGIVERETGPFAMGGAAVSGVMLPLARAREINQSIANSQRSLMRDRAADGIYQMIIVKVTAPHHTQGVEDQIRKLGYGAFSLHDALQNAKRGFLILDIILGLIGSIALAVASLGIMNTMVMSILERTREIGIMKAIGGSDGDVRRIFLIEASVIGFFGGVFGVIIGWAVGRIINFGANQYVVSQGGMPGNIFSVPVWLIAAAIGFSVFVSLAAGILPARRAARLDPIHALRHD